MRRMLFVGLSFAIWFINASVLSGSAAFSWWTGLGATLVSIPVWALLGVFLSAFASFFLRLMGVNVRMDLGGKINIGLALGVVFKPVLGIPL